MNFFYQGCDCILQQAFRYFLNLHNCVNAFRLFLCEKLKIDETSFIKYVVKQIKNGRQIFFLGKTCFHKNVHNGRNDIIAIWQILIRQFHDLNIWQFPFWFYGHLVVDMYNVLGFQEFAHSVEIACVYKCNFMTPDCLSFPLLKPILLQQACPGLPYLFVDCRHLVVCSQVNIVAFQKKSCKL